ncbi:TonB-dependent receptor [Pollutibacter soli]|uniref:TonB-dependent receptor n=1 Tax=Pollutibacter soli TaxID=3034157 RepID=UPI003013FB76
MNKITGLAAVLLLLLPTLVFSQQSIITGKVRNAATKDPVSAVSVTVKNSDYGTFTDENGNFRLALPATQKYPLTLVFTSVGFEFLELNVTQPGAISDISMSQSAALGQEVVISATRLPQRILESPVSVERVSNTALRNAPAANYYDVVSNLKGVDMVASSLTFKTVTTRGFAGSGNTRFNQIMDGMDNQAPGLNFSVGSVIGLSELDVESMELLPGASSALYGPGGMNGTLLVNSKNPFKYQGLSFQIKEGIMHTDGKYRDPSMYHNWNLRWAQKIGNRFAFKITSEFIQAKDWLAADRRNVKRTGTGGEVVPGTRGTDPNYDGINVYGDETSGDIRAVLNGVAAALPSLGPYVSTLTTNPILVSRTGYNERDVTDPNTVNFKLGGSLNYKITNSLEAVLMGYFGTGNTVYTGSDRYSLKDLKMGQYKFELNHTNWFFRAYTTQENSGQSYNTTITTRIFNEAWKPSVAAWFPQYGQAYLTAKLNGLSDQDAHTAARNVADAGRPQPGSDRFNKIYDSVRSRPISQGGGLFLDRTDLYALEGQYNFSHLTGKFADLLVGGNYRRFVLNSQGTLFADSAGKIPINEWGMYAQLTKPFFNDLLKITLSGRYDKNSNFKGRFTPRATAVFKVANNNNIRFSYQQAYRFPSTQQQWINLAVGGGILIGGVPQLKEFYNFTGNPVYSLTDLQNSGQLKVQSFGDFKPEMVTSYEFGYRGLLANQRLLIDAYGYWGQYQDFITRIIVLQSTTANPQPTDVLNPATRRNISVPVNSPTKVKTYGFGVSLDYRFDYGFFVNSNFSSDHLSNVEAGYISYFNAPNYRANVVVGNNAFGKNKRLGFNLAYRWQDAFFYESDLANGTVPAFHCLDAQFSYRIPDIKSVVRIGANNILNQYYVTAMANPSIGGLYYVSFGYNIF